MKGSDKCTTGRTKIDILLAGNSNLCDFYSLFFTKNDINPQIYKDYKNTVKKTSNFSIVVVFVKTDFHSVEDEIKEIKKEITKTPIMVVIENTKFFIIDSLYNLGINKICFNFNPENILDELKNLVDENEVNKSTKEISDKNYIIQFHENHDAFIIDISGPLKEDKLKPLKLMFINYLKNKIDRLKVVVYIFSGSDESTMTFSNIWTLLRIWEEIGIKYNKIAYLTSSEIIKNQINKYFSFYGLKHYENLIELTRAYFPEISKKDETEIFEFSSKLLEVKK